MTPIQAVLGRRQRLAIGMVLGSLTGTVMEAREKKPSNTMIKDILDLRRLLLASNS